jgi:hypothetical protein
MRFAACVNRPGTSNPHIPDQLRPVQPPDTQHLSPEDGGGCHQPLLTYGAGARENMTPP